MPPPALLRIVIVQEDAGDAALLERELRRAGVESVCQPVSAEDAFLAALPPLPDLILADCRIPGFGALAALRLLRNLGLEVPLIVVTGALGDEAAVECLREGATDYLLKDRLGRLGQAVRNAVEQARMRQEQRRLEAQLRQSQKMEAVGQLAGGIAHDFNNLLTVILGYSHLLASRLAAEPDPLSLVEEVRRAGERAAALTHQLLAFSRNQVLQPRGIDLNAVVMDVRTLLRRLIGDDIELVTALGAPSGMAMVDPGQLEQVILNLAVNARDAMPAGGTLTIETAEGDLGAAHRQERPAARVGAHVMMAVSDTGHGMDAETRSHIFERFFTTKEKGKGTGLGLATVYGIVHQSGGHVEVYSEPGHGSTFRVYFPSVAGEAVQPPIWVSAPQPG